MFVSVWRVLGAGVAILLLGMMGMARGSADAAGLKEIEAFNKRFVELHLKMDTSGIMAMWAENGVDLMQGEAPIVGRETITAWLEDILSKMPGYKVTKQEMEFHDIQVCGDWATEWATEHQVAQAPEGKPNLKDTGR